MQTSYGIIVLNQIKDTVTLYCNCVKYGYTKLRYSRNDMPDDVIEIPLSSTEVTVTNLIPGEYTFCAVNLEGKFSLPVFIEMSAISHQQFLSNILIAAGLDAPDCLQIVKQLKTEKYIEELYSLWKNRKKDSPLDKYGEKILSALVSAYNLEQENLNGQFIFSFRISEENIAAGDQIKYKFVPYEFDSETKTWVLEKDNISNDWQFLIHNNKSSVLRQISVLSDFNVVRKYYIYQPSETSSEGILERRISANQIKTEKFHNLLANVDLTELYDDGIGQETVLSLMHLDSKKPIFKKPELTLTDSNKLHIVIPDYEAFSLLTENTYLAALELNEAFSEQIHPHKIKITSDEFDISPARVLINPDQEYLFWITDKNNMVLSNVVLFSFNENFPIQKYTESYSRIVYDEYNRKLYSIFREYRKQDWNIISTLLQRYLLVGIQNDIDIEEFLINQVLQLDASAIQIDVLLQLIILCRLTYYSNIDQHLIQEQVYSKEMYSHIFPERENPYLIKIIKIKGTSIISEYMISGPESASVRIDKNDFVILQCINPTNWKVSAAAFYNNRIKYGQPYFYFPNLKVKVI